jgi:hypothetical protein
LDDASTEFLPVTNYPGENGTRFEGLDDTSSVYVDKLRRIYFFGGSTLYELYDSIWYIELPSRTLPAVE